MNELVWSSEQLGSADFSFGHGPRTCNLSALPAKRLMWLALLSDVRPFIGKGVSDMTWSQFDDGFRKLSRAELIGNLAGLLKTHVRPGMQAFERLRQGSSAKLAIECLNQAGRAAQGLGGEYLAFTCPAEWHERRGTAGNGGPLDGHIHICLGLPKCVIENLPAAAESSAAEVLAYIRNRERTHSLVEHLQMVANLCDPEFWNIMNIQCFVVALEDVREQRSGLLKLAGKPGARIDDEMPNLARPVVMFSLSGKHLVAA